MGERGEGKRLRGEGPVLFVAGVCLPGSQRANHRT